MNPKLKQAAKLPNKFSAPDYLEFVRSVGCAVQDEWCAGEIEAHHMIYRSHEGSDLDAIGLCPVHHTKFHRNGETAFCEEHGIEEGSIQRILIHLYIKHLQAGDRPGVKPEAKKLARGKNLQKPTKRVGTPTAPLTDL